MTILQQISSLDRICLNSAGRNFIRTLEKKKNPLKLKNKKFMTLVHFDHLISYVLKKKVVRAIQNMLVKRLKKIIHHNWLKNKRFTT